MEREEKNKEKEVQKNIEIEIKNSEKKIAEKKHPKSSSTQPKIKSMFLVDKPCQYPLKKTANLNPKARKKLKKKK